MKLRDSGVGLAVARPILTKTQKTPMEPMSWKISWKRKSMMVSAPYGRGEVTKSSVDLSRLGIYQMIESELTPQPVKTC